MPFAGRAEAGRRLAPLFESYRAEHPVVLGLARGGVPVAAEIAALLDAPLDALVVRKIGVPYEPEIAMGAIADETVWLNERLIALLEIPRSEVDRVVAVEAGEVARRETLYRLGRPPLDIAGRTVIVVDDGLATGATAAVGLRTLRERKPRSLIFASPVCSEEGTALLRGEADQVVCLSVPAEFYAVSQAYAAFEQVSDAEVREILEAGTCAGAGPEHS